MMGRVYMFENGCLERLYLKEKKNIPYIYIYILVYFFAFDLLDKETMGRIILVVGDKTTNNSDGQMPPVLHPAATNFNRPCCYYVSLYT